MVATDRSRLGLRGGAWAQRDWVGRPRLAGSAEERPESERLTRSLCANTFRRCCVLVCDRRVALARVGKSGRGGCQFGTRRPVGGVCSLLAARHGAYRVCLLQLRTGRRKIACLAERRTCKRVRLPTCSPGRLFEQRMGMDLSSMTHVYTARH
jgi:hypothetical protein